MRRMIWVGLAVAAALALAAPAGGQGRAPSADPEANIVEELVVVSRHPAPAWWQVQDGDTVVYILGLPDTPVPPDVHWRREELDERLTGANSLIVGPRLHAGLEDIVGLFKLWSQLRTSAPMEDALDPALRARFVAARERVGKGPEPYLHWRPFAAGQLLLRDTRPASSADPTRAIRAEASRHGVTVKAAGEYDLVPFARTALDSLTPQSEGACLASALEDAEAGPEAFRSAAAGWARGDIAADLKAPRHFDRCMLLLAGGPQLWRRSTDDLADAIVQALATPGHAVAVVPLRRLLARDGVVDTLKARGVKVVGPGEE